MDFEIGDVVVGKVKSITDFGAFVDLEDGKSGLVHISEISDSFVKNINDHLQEGQDVKVKIININPSNGKLGLSIKRAQEQNTDNNDTVGSENKFKAKNSFKKVGNSKSNSSRSSRFEDMMAKFIQISAEKVSDFTDKTKRRGASRKPNHKNDF